MKFNFRKIASVIASTVMLSSTVALAAATSYPAPFITNNVADVAVVYSANPLAAATDLTAALDIVNDLNSKLTSSVATTGGSTTLTGEYKAIETGSQKLYLFDYVNSTKSTFTKSEMPQVLADQTVYDTDGTASTVSLKIQTPTTVTKYGKTSDLGASDAPVLYVDFPSSTATYTSDIVFSPAANLTKMTNKAITLFGKKFAFSGSASDLTNQSAVLYESSQTIIVNSGESKTVDVGGKSYALKVSGVEDSTHGTLSVNDVSENVIEGSSYKINGLDVYIKNVMGPSVTGEARSMEISVGSQKLTLTTASSVTKGSTTVDGTTVSYTASSGKVSKISIATTPSSLATAINYLKLGSSMTDPVFGAYKTTFGSYVPALDDATKDKIVIKSSAENRGSMEWTNKDGATYTLEMFTPSAIPLNASYVRNLTLIASGGSYNATKLGYYDGTNSYNYSVNNNTALHRNDYFITNAGQYSQIWRVGSITLNSNENSVTVTDQGKKSGNSYDSVKVTLSGATLGSTGTLTLGDGSTATLNLAGNGSDDTTTRWVTIYTGNSSILYTKSGASIDLTVLANPATYENLTTNNGRITIKEETTYNDGSWTKNNGDTLGSTINASLIYYTSAPTGNDLRIFSTSIGNSTSGSVGDYDNYYLTSYGSFVKLTGSNDQTFTMYYPGTAASLGVYLTDLSSTATTAGNKVVYAKDSDAITATNKIVVGGSCINTVAATLLGGAYCGADFTTKTSVGAGSYLIQTFADTDGNGVATLVAGYNAEDTVNAATAFRTLSSVDLTVGKKFTGSTKTSVTAA